MSGRIVKRKDPNAPKKPATAFFIWLNENRDRLKKPGMRASDVAKQAGVEWRALTDDGKKTWEKKAEDAKKAYNKAMEVYNAGQPQ